MEGQAHVRVGRAEGLALEAHGPLEQGDGLGGAALSHGEGPEATPRDPLFGRQSAGQTAEQPQAGKVECFRLVEPPEAVEDRRQRDLVRRHQSGRRPRVGQPDREPLAGQRIRSGIGSGRVLDPSQVVIDGRQRLVIGRAHRLQDCPRPQIVPSPLAVAPHRLAPEPQFVQRLHQGVPG